MLFASTNKLINGALNNVKAKGGPALQLLEAINRRSYFGRG